MNTSKPEDVLLSKNGQIQCPIELDVVLVITKICCSFIGLPINILLAMIIIRFRRLYSKPRNIFLLGIIFANLLAFLSALIELVYWNVPIESVCQSYVAIAGLPYAVLLLNLSLALGDRYVAITYPLWHRKKVTVNRTVWFLTLSILPLIFILKFVYITGIAPLRCEILFLHSKVVGWTLMILLVLCITIHFIVYRKTKSILREIRNIEHSANEVCSTKKSRRTFQNSNDRNRTEEEVNLAKIDFPKSVVILNELQQDGASCFVNERATTSIPNSHSTSMGIRVTSGVLSQMELEATRTLIAGVTSLFLMVFPVMLFFLSLFFCRLTTQSDCRNVSWLAPYFKELCLVYAVCNPLIYILRNNELWLVFKNGINNCTTKSHVNGTQ